MVDTTLRYDKWIEEALRGVIRRALAHAADHGMPGNHHFYLTFRTDAPGVDLPSWLKAQHPEEMTVVLQHQFWDLAVDEEEFSVTLKFRGRDTRIRVPIAAIGAFVDPSVNFGLQLQRLPTQSAAGEEPAEDGEAPPIATNGEIAEVITLDTFRKK